MCLPRASLPLFISALSAAPVAVVPGCLLVSDASHSLRAHVRPCADGERQREVAKRHAQQQIGAEEKRQLGLRMCAKYPNRRSSLFGAGLSGAEPQVKEIPSLQSPVLFSCLPPSPERLLSAIGARHTPGCWWAICKRLTGLILAHPARRTGHGIGSEVPAASLVWREGCSKPGGSRYWKRSEFRPDFPLPLALPLCAVTLCSHLEQRVARIARPCGRLAASASCRDSDTDLYFG